MQLRSRHSRIVCYLLHLPQNEEVVFAGRRSKPKRHFIMPALRQAAPIGSKYVEPVTECHWKCKLCKGDILAAVISAGAIRHFRTVHPEELEHMQYELCKVLPVDHSACTRLPFKLRACIFVLLV